MTRPTIILTGATSGFGRETLRTLARDTRVNFIVGVREPGRAAEIRDISSPQRLTILPFDANSLASVRAFAHAIKQRGHGWDALMANAGLQVVGRLERSVDGFEKTFAVNYLANFVLLQELLEAANDGARMVVTASGTHNPADRTAVRFGFRGGIYTSAQALAEGSGDPNVSEDQRGRDRYATSKLAVLLGVYEWARRYPQIDFLGYDPGLVPGTGLARGHNKAFNDFVFRRVMPILRPLIPGTSTPQASGASLAWLLTEPSLRGQSGTHYSFERKEERTSEDSYRLDLAHELFEASMAWSLRKELAPA